METQQYDQLYQLYTEFDTQPLREYQDFVDLFPPLDSRVALTHWQEASNELDRKKTDIAEMFTDGETLAEIAARADRDAAFTAIDLYNKYGRSVNALILDVDETLRSAGGTDNEIPRETLHVLTEFHDAGMPIIICTGQTLENVKGFMIQGLGNEIVHSGNLSIVYEAGTGVFTPGHGSDTKQLLYESLDPAVRDVFDEIRGRVLPDAPSSLRRGCHLQGNEFNVTLKPNFETGSDRAEAVIDEGLLYLLDLLADAVCDAPERHEWARSYYAAVDPEIKSVLESKERLPTVAITEIPDAAISLFDRIDVAYYHADAAEISSRELNKVAGVEAALSVLGITDPFVTVMGDSKSDLRVMQWASEQNTGLAAAPSHASEGVLSHVRETDELVFDRGKSADMLRIIYVLNLLAAIQ